MPADLLRNFFVRQALYLGISNVSEACWPSEDAGVGGRNCGANSTASM